MEIADAMPQPTIFVLLVSSLQGATAFFRDGVGCTIHSIADPGWLCFRRDGYEFMVYEPVNQKIAAPPPPSLSMGTEKVTPCFAYLAVPDVVNDYRRAMDQGVALFKPLRDEPWGWREFGLCTADGHRIMMGQNLTS